MQSNCKEGKKEEKDNIKCCTVRVDYLDGLPSNRPDAMWISLCCTHLVVRIVWQHKLCTKWALCRDCEVYSCRWYERKNIFVYIRWQFFIFTFVVLSFCRFSAGLDATWRRNDRLQDCSAISDNKRERANYRFVRSRVTRNNNIFFIVEFLSFERCFNERERECSCIVFLNIDKKSRDKTNLYYWKMRTNLKKCSK